MVDKTIEIDIYGSLFHEVSYKILANEINVDLDICMRIDDEIEDELNEFTFQLQTEIFETIRNEK